MSEQRWRVRAKSGTFGVTYVCRTPRAALAQAAHFEQQGNQDVIITAPDGAMVSRADLDEIVTAPERVREPAAVG